MRQQGPSRLRLGERPGASRAAVENDTAGRELKNAAFWRNVEKRGHRGCWAWTGRCDKDGYGVYGRHRAHRVSFELANHPISVGKVIDHKCRQRACVRPAHLREMSDFANRKR